MRAPSIRRLLGRALAVDQQYTTLNTDRNTEFRGLRRPFVGYREATRWPGPQRHGRSADPRIAGRSPQIGEAKAAILVQKSTSNRKTGSQTAESTSGNSDRATTVRIPT